MDDANKTIRGVDPAPNQNTPPPVFDNLAKIEERDVVVKIDEGQFEILQELISLLRLFYYTVLIFLSLILVTILGK